MLGLDAVAGFGSVGPARPDEQDVKGLDLSQHANEMSQDGGASAQARVMRDREQVQAGSKL